MKKILIILALAGEVAGVSAREYHVSVQGDDRAPGTQTEPLRTISAAAQFAQPGDTVTVHAGVYRERVNPPRGGNSDQERIVYQAAPGENVVVKGSEIVRDWEKVQGDTWKVVLPNRFFGKFNPYRDLIRGDWFGDKGRAHHTGAVYLDGHWLTEAAARENVMRPAGETPLWFGEVDESTTTIWAQFMEVDPNQADVEINVRQTVFYPDQPGRNYITVRGFTMMHAATPWAPPTAEQIGLIGTHWSKGWIIEDNDVSYSTCVGITLGKYGDQWDNTSQNSAEGYVKTIERALANGWSGENIGHHIVRRNRISHCEQAGIVGSLGAIFSTVTGNEIHDIHVRQLFTGAEMAGIKFHAAIDTVISRNHIYRCVQGIWLDWMTQGTRVTRNLLHDNHWWQDLFVEVNHGPFLVDNNLFLSSTSLSDMSEGGAYVHNLFAGQINSRPELNRETPYHPAHTTAVAGLRRTQGGDDRFLNNLFVGGNGLATYDQAALPVQMSGNVFLNGASPSKHENNPLVLPDYDPEIKIAQKGEDVLLHLKLETAWGGKRSRDLVTTDRLGRAKIPDLPYVHPDGSPYRIDTDYFGRQRDTADPFPGPFVVHDSGMQTLEVWPDGSNQPDASTVDFRYAPPEWQTAICLPDDPQKSLVDRTGELLYHYGQSGREFATRIGVETVPDAGWEKQELLSPRVPIVRTFRSAHGLEILQESFAVTGLSQPKESKPVVSLQRVDGGGNNQNWAKPPPGTDPSLRHIAVHMNGNIRFAFAAPQGASRRVALALCEGWWSEAGKRMQVLRVEGAEPKTVDTVADIGPNQAAAFWFDGTDANHDGKIEVVVEAAPEAADKNTILNGLWIFAPSTTPDSDALLAGKLNGAALASLDSVHPGGPSRNDLILVRVTNQGTQPRIVHPRLIVDTTLDFAFQPEAQRVIVNGHETITSSLRMTGQVDAEKTRRTIQLDALDVPAGESAAFYILYGTGATIVIEPNSIAQAKASREHAVEYWENAPLPFGRVRVPDAGIQALVDSSIRNIWQAREIKQGMPAFQVGPTCYRGLWIVDGAFLLESAAMLGKGREARNGVAYELTYQKPDGRIEVMANYPKENGIVLWTCIRHARLTQDKAWLESLWPKLTRVAEYIKTLRRRTLENNTPLDDGLIPPGFPDGGIGGIHAEYTNPYWNLVGLKAFIRAAHWLGKTEEAAAWQKEYDAFMAAFWKAAERDLTKDSHGNLYLPILMGEAGRNELPQRGQWAFCHAVYPGQIFAKNDPLVAGTMAMLEATEREGMVFGTGWDPTGIWNYFASFYGHAWLWQGNGPKAAQILYAFANHAAPTCVWREEQSLQGEKFRKVGDMPHNWASAEFIRLAIHLLALDRGNELHLLEGFPREWSGPDMLTRLDGVATPFGPLSMKVQVDQLGKTATLDVNPLADNCKAVIVHLPLGGTKSIPPQQGGSVRFSL